MKFIVVLALLCALAGLCYGASIESIPTSTSSNTYFGVDANDLDAVREKQRELADEQWRRMFPDTDIDDINFVSDKVVDGLEVVRSAVNALIDKIERALPRNTTDSPTTPTM